tara:strand:+ start:95 stop:685 length:591 start_codon:yes stop_codon:yes gene_type:complete
MSASKQANKYAYGKIYILINNFNDMTYVGSTCSSLETRKYGHRHNPVLKVGEMYNDLGWEHLQIWLVEKYPCQSRSELLQRERHWFDALSPKLNVNRPWCSEEEKEEAIVASRVAKNVTKKREAIVASRVAKKAKKVATEKREAIVASRVAREKREKKERAIIWEHEYMMTHDKGYRAAIAAKAAEGLTNVDTEHV